MTEKTTKVEPSGLLIDRTSLPPLAPELAEIPEVYRECLAIATFFLMMGVDNDDVSLGVGKAEDGQGSALIMVANTTPSPMVILVAPLPDPIPVDAIAGAWTRAVEVWNSVSDDARHNAVMHTHTVENYDRFLADATSSGVVFPKIFDLMAMLNRRDYKGPQN